MPDYYIYKAPTCACGDDAVRIPDARRSEGLLQRSHWCTGTLQMTDGFGNPRYLTFIYPFSNAFIIDKAHAFIIDKAHAFIIDKAHAGTSTTPTRTRSCAP